METISPQTSPTASISPPVTPFSIALPHTYALPPLKTLPTWNRNKFKDDKLVRSVPKNKNIKVELIGHIGQIENCTQTSPHFSSESLSSSKVSTCRRSDNMNNINKFKKSYDKKIVFLETTHKEVLSNLHQELEKLKRQNRVLKFQLVMAGEDASGIQIDNDEKADAKMIYNNNTNKETEETKVLKTEIKELKKLLNEADSKNVQLTKLIEQLKQRASSRINSGNHKTKTIPRNRSDYSINNNNNIQKRESSAKIVLKQEETDPGSKNEKQNEVSLPEEKVQKQNMESSVILPKLEQPNNRSAPLGSSAVRGMFKRTQEPLSLPVIQGLPAANRNMTLRQKRAQALHVRRQRSNKNVTLTAATTAINNE